MTIDMMTSAPRRLPVWAITTRAYGYVWDHRRPFAIPVLLLFAALIATTILMQLPYLAAAQSGGSVPLGAELGALVGYIAKTTISIAFAVGVHRTVLLGEGREGLSFFRWDENFRRYFVTMLLIVLIAVGYMLSSMLLAALVGGIGVFVGKLAGGGIGAVLMIGFGIAALAGYLWLTAQFCRVILALPAAALGEPDALALSWRVTRGNGWLLLGVSFLAALPVLVAAAIAEAPYVINAAADKMAQPHAPTTPPGLGTIVALALIGALSAPVLITVLSLSYDVLARGGGPRD